MRQLYEAMFINSELRQFIPAVKILAARLYQIDEYYPDLRLQLDLVETEEEMLYQILQQEFLNFTILGKNNIIWCPTKEAFKTFSEEQRPITIQPATKIDEKRKHLCMWVLSMCDWVAPSYQYQSMPLVEH